MTAELVKVEICGNVCEVPKTWRDWVVHLATCDRCQGRQGHDRTCAEEKRLHDEYRRSQGLPV